MSKENYSHTNPSLVLPVGISQDSFEGLIDAGELDGMLFTRDADSSVLYMEIGSARADTPDFIAEYLDEHFNGLLDEAVSQECEAIQFYIN
jgi:hypothetical protein